MKKIIGLITLGLAMLCAGGGMDVYEIVMSGQKLSADEAAQLEESLVEKPSDLQARKKLLGYYMMLQYQDATARKTRQGHVLWLIENASADQVLSLPYGQLNAHMDGSSYEKGRALWAKLIEDDPVNIALLRNAANYCLQHDRKRSELYLLKGAELEPNNPEWPKSLGQLYSMDDSVAPEVSAGKELEQLEKAFERSDMIRQGYLRADMAKSAFQAGEYAKAKQYAEKMLSGPGTDWNSGNNVHHGNMVLGLVALQEGDSEAAKTYLIASGKTKGSPQLNSFGPNMTLAKAMLEKGETETVLEYFELCAVFWEMHRDRLDQWAAIAKDGMVPDFGANLNY
jgi:hypothetical protein